MDRAVEEALRRLKRDPADREACEDIERLCLRIGCPRPLMFHGELAKGLAWRPKVDAARLAWIREREAALGSRLPLALREWLSLEGSETLFNFSSRAAPMALERHGDHLVLLKKRNAFRRCGLVLDGSEDPSVVMMDDEEGERVAERFSDFARRFVRGSLRAYGAYNRSAWEHYRVFFRRGLEIERIADLVDRGSRRPDAARFHPGNSVYNLVISTTAYFGLEEQDLVFAVGPAGEGRLGITEVSVDRRAPRLIADQAEARALFDARLDELWQRSRGLDLPNEVFEGEEEDPYPF